MHTNSITIYTNWLREEPSLIAARIAYLIREKGVDTRQAVCAKIFPDTVNPTGGAIVTEHGKVYQFVFNRSGMVMELSDIEEWTDITGTFMDHPWRDEILTGQQMIKDGR